MPPFWRGWGRSPWFLRAARFWMFEASGGPPATSARGGSVWPNWRPRFSQTPLPGLSNGLGPRLQSTLTPPSARSWVAPFGRTGAGSCRPNLDNPAAHPGTPQGVAVNCGEFESPRTRYPWTREQPRCARHPPKRPPTPPPTGGGRVRSAWGIGGGRDVAIHRVFVSYPCRRRLASWKPGGSQASQGKYPESQVPTPCPLLWGLRS